MNVNRVWRQEGLKVLKKQRKSDIWHTVAAVAFAGVRSARTPAWSLDFIHDRTMNSRPP